MAKTNHQSDAQSHNDRMFAALTNGRRPVGDAIPRKLAIACCNLSARGDIDALVELAETLYAAESAISYDVADEPPGDYLENLSNDLGWQYTFVVDVIRAMPDDTSGARIAALTDYEMRIEGVDRAKAFATVARSQQ